MPRHSSKFSDIVLEVARANELRAELILKAFAVLESQYAEIAHMLLQTFSNRQRAANWMSMHQRRFDGRSAYEVLAEGGEDWVWDEISRLGGHEGAETIRLLEGVAH